ncbi:MAG: ABC1 kinase family protein [Candidatus Acidiferrales bacterium]
MALSELGGAFIKLGQMLSTRGDLIGPEYRQELSKLQDDAPHLDAATIRRTIETELDAPISQFFAEFTDHPVAAASIGQAHQARLLDGTSIILKVRRPGIIELVNSDLEILRRLAARIAHRSSWARQINVVGFVEEFSDMLRSELDYVQEGHSIERFAVIAQRSQTRTRVPRVFWETTTTRVLTLERMVGVKADDIASLDSENIDTADVAKRLMALNLQSVFEDGFFHADPHPGNLFIEPDGGIALIDFGEVGEISPQMRDRLALLFAAITSRNSDRLLDAILDLTTTNAAIDRQALAHDFERLISHYYGANLESLSISDLLNDLTTALRRSHLQIPTNLALLFKSWSMLEALVRTLDPAASPASYFEPFLRSFMEREYGPIGIAKRSKEAVFDTLLLAEHLPRQIHRVLTDLERGHLTVQTQVADLSSFKQEMRRFENRIVIAAITGSFIVALAVLMVVYHPSGWERWAGPAFLFGFIVAALGGLVLAWSIVSGKRYTGGQE